MLVISALWGGLSRVLLSHLLQLRPELLLILQFLVSNLLLFHVFPALSFLHLPHEFSLVVVLALFPRIEFLLGYVLECVAGLHVLDFFPRWRVGLVWIYLCSCKSISALDKGLFQRLVLSNLVRIDWLHIDLIELRSLVVLLQEHLRVGTSGVLNAPILLTLASESVVRGDDVTISISDWRSSSLVTGTDPVVVCKVMHGFCFLLGLPLFLDLLLLLLLGNLSCQICFEFVLLLLLFDELSGFTLPFQRNGRRLYLLLGLATLASQPAISLRELTVWLLIGNINRSQLFVELRRARSE